jgi:AraC-like DNA-binding protein
MLPPGSRGPHLIFQADFDNRLESHRNPAIHPKFEFQDGLLAPRFSMHGDPARRWALIELAKASAMSRTVFASRFKTAAGVPARAYLHHWRMHIASAALRNESQPLAQLSQSLGYASESAFSTALRRNFVISPV